MSIPSNNFVNGMKVNVPTHMLNQNQLLQSEKRGMDANNINMASMTSQDFSSALRSNPTINNISVNLNRPVNGGTMGGTMKSSTAQLMGGNAPLQIC